LTPLLRKSSNKRFYINKTNSAEKTSTNSQNADCDELHIPHLGFHHWIDKSKPETIKASQSDKNKRPFGIRFFLTDTRAHTPYVFMHAPETKEYSYTNKNHTMDIWFEEDNMKKITKPNYCKQFLSASMLILRKKLLV